MKPIKITTTAALMAMTPIAAQAAMPMAMPLSVPAAPAMTGDAGQVQPVFLDLRQLERDMLVLLHGKGGNGGDSRDRSRDGNSDDGNSDDRNDDDDNGGNSDGGNGGNS